MTIQNGRFYTMSREKRNNDGSWTSQVWEVIEQNATHALIVAVTRSPYSSFGSKPMLVLIDQFDFTPAGDLAAAISDYSQEKVR